MKRQIDRIGAAWHDERDVCRYVMDVWVGVAVNYGGSAGLARPVDDCGTRQGADKLHSLSRFIW